MLAQESYWDPIYILEHEQEGNLFPFRNCLYHVTKEEAIRIFKRFDNTIRLIEKSMWTGKETVIMEKEKK